MVIFYVQAVSSVSLTVRSVSALCRVRMSHFRSAPGAGGQVLPVTAAPLGVLCSGLGPPPPIVCPAVHSEGTGVPGPLSLSISTDAGKWDPRK